jgi:tetratricopeptide (TPR) repeat protein
MKMQGNSLAQQGKFADARDMYMRALEIAPSSAAYKLHSNLSLVALSAGDPAEAISQARKALDLAPDDFTTVLSLIHGLFLW